MDYEKMKREMHDAFMKAFELHGWEQLSWLASNKKDAHNG
jgi:hypothetical protein